MQPDPGGGDCAGVELPFGPDVEHAGAEGQGDAEPDDDEGDRADQGRRSERIPRAERAIPERAERGDRIVPRELQPDGKDRNPGEQRRDRRLTAHLSP